jgi:hypothetical protein
MRCMTSEASIVLIFMIIYSILYWEYAANKNMRRYLEKNMTIY